MVSERNNYKDDGLMLRKTSSGQILQGKQMRHIEELERVISEKMGIIKRIDNMIQVNNVKKQQSTPQPSQ